MTIFFNYMGTGDQLFSFLLRKKEMVFYLNKGYGLRLDIRKTFLKMKFLKHCNELLWIIIFFLLHLENKTETDVGML